MRISLRMLTLGCCTPLLSLAADRQPNVILIMTDQLSYNMISAHADLFNGSYSNTPNIDRLVKSGVSFTQTYCANPVSVPSRFALFTGRYGGKFQIRENKCDAAVESDVRALLKTNAMGFLFKQGGYETYYGGKVHLPFSGLSGSSKFTAPQGYGFDVYLTDDERDGLAQDVARFLSERESTDIPFLLVASFLNPHDICLESSTNLSTVIEPDSKDPEKVATVQMMRDRAEAYDSVYFYDEVAPPLPLNFERTQEFPAKFKKNNFNDFPEWYWRKYRWIYGQLVTLVDDHIGKILDALDARPDLKENTIVVFTSDHGEMQASHQAVTKNLPYEECQRVPFIFAGKGIPKNKRNHTLVCNGVDLLSTLCDLAQIALPSKTDGLSLVNHIFGKSSYPQRKFLYAEGDGFLQIKKDCYKFTYFDELNEEMMIDMQTDSFELQNVIKSSLEYREKAKEFRSLLKDPFNGIVTSLYPNEEPDVIQVYPIPACEYLMINVPKDVRINNIRIFSLGGNDHTGFVQFVKEAGGIVKVDVSKLSNGFYLLKEACFESMFLIDR